MENTNSQPKQPKQKQPWSKAKKDFAIDVIIFILGLACVIVGAIHIPKSGDYHLMGIIITCIGSAMSLYALIDGIIKFKIWSAEKKQQKAQ